jgi:hypothetical protein
MGNKKVALFQINTQLAQILLHGLVAFVSIESGIDD